MADPVPPSPPADQASPEETYARLEREYHARRLPPHHFYHTEHARLKQEYESLSASYLQTLELWPGYAKRHRLLEDLMETTRAGIRDYSSPASQSCSFLLIFILEEASWMRQRLRVAVGARGVLPLPLTTSQLWPLCSFPFIGPILI